MRLSMLKALQSADQRDRVNSGQRPEVSGHCPEGTSPQKLHSWAQLAGRPHLASERSRPSPRDRSTISQNMPMSTC